MLHDGREVTLAVTVQLKQLPVGGSCSPLDYFVCVTGSTSKHVTISMLQSSAELQVSIIYISGH